MRRILAALVLCCLLPLGAGATSVDPETPPAPAAPPHLIERFKALAGHWSGEGLDGNSAPGVEVGYTVTAGGNAVEELLFAGTAHEMRTLYMRDGDDVVLLHVCASGNHPKMRARQEQDGRISFDFDGAMNFDPATAGHMHDAVFTFVGPDEIRTRWRFWAEGKPSGYNADLHLKRVKSDG